jgi:site-specific recombinase XerD
MITSFAQLKTVRGLDSGPLNPFVEDYIAQLRGQGYQPGGIRGHLVLFAKLNAWLADEGLDIADLDEQALECFAKCPLFRGRSRAGELSALLRLLAILRERGAAPPAEPATSTPAQSLTESYRRFLHEERGASDWTLSNYARHIERFLEGLFGTRKVCFQKITPRAVTGFVQGAANEHSRPYMKQVVTAMRSFLRFLHYRGHLASDISSAVPKVAHWRMTALPKHLPPEAVQRVLDACDRTNPVGKRNFAILLLLARLGLRAGEIVALQIEDIDWHAAHLTVRSKKGGGWARLPLPADVGEAIARYLKNGRPPCESRNVFVRAVAPHVPLSGSPVIAVMTMQAMKKAGVFSPHTGAHVFRHSLASEMLRRGASLQEIGQVLRHKDPETTAIYAKVDLGALRKLAVAWPQGGVR